jgi:Transposase DDE domain
MIFDRGYYSKQVLNAATDCAIKVVFRLKKDAFKATSRFYHSTSTHQSVTYLNNQQELKTAYLYKYFIEGKMYMCLTNFSTTAANVKHLYGLRWRVETSFRRLKSNLLLEKAHSMSLDLYVQEIEARILLDTLTMMTTNNVVVNKTVHKQLTYYQVLDHIQVLLFYMKVAAEGRLNLNQTVRLIRQFKPGRTKNNRI